MTESAAAISTVDFYIYISNLHLSKAVPVLGNRHSSYHTPVAERVVIMPTGVSVESYTVEYPHTNDNVRTYHALTFSRMRENYMDFGEFK